MHDGAGMVSECPKNGDRQSEECPGNEDTIRDHELTLCVYLLDESTKD